jgi:hypothetical protein
VTTTGAVPAVPGGATALISVGDSIVKELAALLANVTVLAPLKFEPIIETVLPPDTGPDEGISPVMVGVGVAV